MKLGISSRGQLRGALTYSSPRIGRPRRSRSAFGWKKVYAIAVGINADATTVTRRDGWMKALSAAATVQSSARLGDPTPGGGGWPRRDQLVRSS